MVLLGSVLAAVSGSAAVGAQTSCNVSDATTQATDAYVFHSTSDNGNAETATAAYRVLIALGATLPAWTGSQISGAAPTTPITEAQLRAFTSGRNDTWAGWNPIYTALNCLESASPTVTVGVAEPAGHRQPALTAVVANEGANSVIMVRIPNGMGSHEFTFGFSDSVAEYAPSGASATATAGYDCQVGDLVNTSLYTARAPAWNPSSNNPGGNNNTGPLTDVVGTKLIFHKTTRSSGDTVNVPVTLCPGSEGKTFGLKWSIEARYPFDKSFAHDAPNCKDHSRSFNRQTGTHHGIDWVIPAYKVHMSFSCWTTVKIVGQGGGMGAVEEGVGQPAPQDSQPAQDEGQPTQEEPVVEPEPGPVCVSDALLADVEGYAAETWRKSADHVPRWSRVLAAFGQANSYSSDPMTASEAQTYADRSWGSRWVPVTAALQCLEAEAS